MDTLKDEILNFIITNNKCKAAILQEDIVSLTFIIMQEFELPAFRVTAILNTIFKEISLKDATFDTFYAILLPSEDPENISLWYLGINSKGEIISEETCKLTDWVGLIFLTEGGAKSFIEKHSIENWSEITTERLYSEFYFKVKNLDHAFIKI